ncbi:hypothetical protein GGI10_004174, partial [Coemansia sp. RSA 2530]
ARGAAAEPPGAAAREDAAHGRRRAAGDGHGDGDAHGRGEADGHAAAVRVRQVRRAVRGGGGRGAVRPHPRAHAVPRARRRLLQLDGIRCCGRRRRRALRRLAGDQSPGARRRDAGRRLGPAVDARDPGGRARRRGKVRRLGGRHGDAGAAVARGGGGRPAGHFAGAARVQRPRGRRRRGGRRPPAGVRRVLALARARADGRARRHRRRRVPAGARAAPREAGDAAGADRRRGARGRRRAAHPRRGPHAAGGRPGDGKVAVPPARGGAGAARRADDGRRVDERRADGGGRARRRRVAAGRRRAGAGRRRRLLHRRVRGRPRGGEGGGAGGHGAAEHLRREGRHRLPPQRALLGAGRHEPPGPIRRRVVAGCQHGAVVAAAEPLRPHPGPARRARPRVGRARRRLYPGREARRRPPRLGLRPPAGLRRLRPRRPPPRVDAGQRARADALLPAAALARPGRLVAHDHPPAGVADPPGAGPRAPHVPRQSPCGGRRNRRHPHGSHHELSIAAPQHQPIALAPLKNPCCKS